jgi:hypothetical protein
MPVIICKRLCASNSRFFVIAVDGSDNSRNGFEIAMALVNPKDKLHCVTVMKNSTSTSSPAVQQGEGEDKQDDEEEGGEDKELDKASRRNLSKLQSTDMSMLPADIQYYYSTELNSYGPANSEFISLTCAHNETIAECLVGYSDSVQADFFAISPRARPIFTSVTEYIITTVKANIILCKN